MRVGLLVAVVLVALGVAASASAAVFPSLPGLDVAERAIKGDVARVEGKTTHTDGGTTSSSDAGDDVAVDLSPSTKTGSASNGNALLSDISGDVNIPVIGGARLSSRGMTSVLPLLLLAASVVVFMTRFLFRLNTIR